MAWLYAIRYTLYSYMGNHITVEAHEGAAFDRNAKIIADSMRAKEKEISLLDDELEVGAARVALYSMPTPELAAFASKARRADRRQAASTEQQRRP
jgi:hypothetical protein